MPASNQSITRCPWPTDELYRRYHDEEWGVPLHDDRALFELLTLEGAQAGLSWITVLKRREGYRSAFENFDAERVAAYGSGDIERLMADTGIIRNRAKIESTIRNAEAFLRLKGQIGSFDRYLWQFVHGAPIVNSPVTMSDVPAMTPLSDALSKDLMSRGFNFVGSTICYAFMPANGMVNDHLVSCFRYSNV